MRRILMILALMAISAPAVRAQDEWQFTQTQDVPEAGFSFKYPEGFTLTESGAAFFMTESEADFSAEIDAKPDTVPEGVVIYLIGGSPADFGLSGGTASVADIGVAVAQTLAITPEQAIDIAIMGKAAAGALGTLPDGRAAAYAAWTDDGIIFVFGIEAPTMDAIGALGDDFGSMVSQFSNTPVAPLDATVALASPGYSISVPSTWTLEQQDGGFTLIEELSPDEQSTPAARGMILVNLHLTTAELLEHLGIETLTLDDLQRFLSDDYFLFENPITAEMGFAFAPARSVRGKSAESGLWIEAVFVILGPDIEIFIHAAQEDVALEAYEPTLDAILQSGRFTQSQ